MTIWKIQGFIHRIRKGRLLTYEEVQSHFQEGDMVVSLKDGITYKYSGRMCMGSSPTAAKAYDDFNNDLVLYDNRKLAEKKINLNK